MSLEFNWEEPPPTQRRAASSSEYVELVEKLRANPGRWAHLGRRKSQLAGNIKGGRVKAFSPAGDFEAVTRNSDGDRMADIYVRYIGED